RGTGGGAGTVGVPRAGAVSAAHGLLERVKAPKGRPVEKIPIPRSRRTCRVHRGLCGAALKTTVSGVIGGTGQRIKISRVARGVCEGGGRSSSATRQRSARRGFASPVAHTARIVHHDDDVRRRHIRNEWGLRSVIGVHLCLRGVRTQQSSDYGE